jgi:Tol biopolymer transport system component
MRPLRRVLLLMLALAAVSWALALRHGPVVGAGERTKPARGEEHLAYPGAARLTVRRVLAEADGRYWPTPDGTGFTYVDDAGELAILDVLTGETRPVPGGAAVREGRDGEPGFVFQSRMSPDGRRVAYQLNRDGHWAIRVVDLEDGSVRDLLEHPDTIGWPDLGSWSPDSRTIAVAMTLDGFREPPGTIVLVRVDDGIAVEIAAFESRAAMNVNFSPDGQWLAYQRVRGMDSNDGDVFLRPAGGGPELRLTRSPGDHQVVGWLPGGGPLFYLAGQGGRYTLLAVEVENGRPASEPRRVRSDLWHVWPRGLSRSGFFFVQMPERLKAHIASIDPAAGRLTSPLTPIVPATSVDWTSFMTWSASGDRVAHFAGHDLVVRSMATGAERRIRTGFRDGGIGALTWSPVVDRIAVQAFDQLAGTWGVHIVDLADGSVELVIPGGSALSRFQPWWSPDGQALFVGRRDPGRAGIGIVRFDLATGEELEVFRVERYAGFALHPDGRRLAVGQRGASPHDADRVIVAPLDGGEPRELARIPAPGTLSRGNAGFDWSPDGRYLLIGSNPDAEHRRTLWIVDAADGHVREVASFVSDGGMQVRPRFHPGGQAISVIAGRNRWEIWALEQLRPERLDPARR